MNREPRKQTELCATTNGVCRVYQGAIPYGGRKLIRGTEVFRIGNVLTSCIYFEGRPDEHGVIRWTRTTSGKAAKATGTWNYQTGFYSIEFDESELAKDEEITLSYKWQPHHLTGAMVMIRINNEDRLIPIEELQAALVERLTDD